jgi:hypothetical protein
LRVFKAATLFTIALTTFGAIGGAWTIGGLIFDELWFRENVSIFVVNSLYLFSIPSIIYITYSYDRDTGSFQSPKVKMVLDDGKLLMEPCGWVSIGTFVTIYSSDNDVETILGLGFVVNIQENKMPQVQIENIDNITIEKLKHARTSLRIKPGLNRNV